MYFLLGGVTPVIGAGDLNQLSGRNMVGSMPFIFGFACCVSTGLAVIVNSALSVLVLHVHYQYSPHPHQCWSCRLLIAVNHTIFLIDEEYRRMIVPLLKALNAFVESIATLMGIPLTDYVLMF